MPPRARTYRPKPSLPIADRIRPRTAPARRLSADLAAALLVGWQRGYDFTEHFPQPHNLYEIADIIQFFIEPMIQRDRDYGGPPAAAALHWLGVVRLCNYGEITRLITDHQMQEGVWDEEAGVPCDLGSGYFPRANRNARAALRRLGLLKITLASNGLVVTLVIHRVLQLGADAVLTALNRKYGTRGARVRIEKLSRVVGTVLTDQVGTMLTDQVGTALTDKEQQIDTHRAEAKDQTDLASASVPPPASLDVEISGAAILPAASDGSQLDEPPAPAIKLPTRVARWLASEDCPQLSTFSRRRLADASEEDIRRAHRYATDWRRSARAHRTDSAEQQFVALATTGSLPLQRQQVLAFLLASPKARPQFRDAAAEVTRRLARLHPTWIDGRINKTSRQSDVENPWAYLLAALENRADHERWLKDRRSSAIVKAEQAEA